MGQRDARANGDYRDWLLLCGLAGLVYVRDTVLRDLKLLQFLLVPSWGATRIGLVRRLSSGIAERRVDPEFGRCPHKGEICRYERQFRKTQTPSFPIYFSNCGTKGTGALQRRQTGVGHTGRPAIVGPSSFYVPLRTYPHLPQKIFVL